MRREVLLERFFTALISGDRPGSRALVDECLHADVSAEKVISRLFWPTMEHVENLHRGDNLSDMAHHYAVRLLRMLADQMQLRLTQGPRRDRKVLILCGPDETNELAAQMAADIIEADGYDIYFAGGGVANDEVVAQLSNLQADVMCIFGGSPTIVPFTRQLIDQLHEMAICPAMQVVVGGGIFNRAQGLAEEIGADLWAAEPEELVKLMAAHPEQRMANDQRTVGRRRRVKAA
ncbi:MAG: cobalamin-dependent protein [Phycisphaeraceae bacterium]